MSRKTVSPSSGDGQCQGLRERIARLERELAGQAAALEVFRESGQVYRDVFEVCQEPIFVVDEAEGGIVEANPAACGRYGFAREEMLGLRFAELTADGNSGLSSLACGGDICGMHKDRSGRLFPVEIASGSFVRKGRRVFIAFVRDVSWRKLAEERLRRNEARYRAIVEDQTELVARILPDGRLSFVNEAFCRFFEIERDDVLGTLFSPAMPEDDRKIVAEALAGLSPEQPLVSFERRVVLPDGRTRWLFTSQRALFDERGELSEFQAVSRIIDKRKRAEEQLRENQEFLRLVIDTVPSPIFVKNRQGVFTLVNKAMAERYGCAPEELVGRKGRDFNPDAGELARHRLEDIQVLETGRPVFIPQKTITNSKGKKRWYSNTKLPLPGKDQILGVAVDITDRIEAEEERSRLEANIRTSQKMQALGTLAGGIAHDFNNMIYAILGFARLAMKQAEPGSKLASYLEQIQSAGLRSSQLVRQILAFSRQADQETAPVRLTPLIEEIGRMMEAALPPDVNLRFTSTAKNDVALGDSGRLHQVLLNLCSNAAHAMRERVGFIDVFLRQVRIDETDAAGIEGASTGRYLEIEVRDAGYGMDQATVERIFEPFFTTKKPGEGTGMGLSVVHGIVQSHGGFIRVESEPGRGSSFRVYLPERRDVEAGETSRSGALPRGQENILIVDNEPSITSVVQSVLSGLGYQTTALNVPLEAARAFFKDPKAFDLVLVNRVMPGMSGEDFANEVLALRKDLPVLLMTGYADPDAVNRALVLGIREVLIKPIQEERLALAVRRALDGNRDASRNKD